MSPLSFLYLTVWNMTEDDLLVQTEVKHSTSVLVPDWSEVESELSGRCKQQCKERYRLDDTVVELTFVLTVEQYVHQHYPHTPHSHMHTGS
jgi:hypothetical protein